MPDTPRKTKANGHIIQADWNQTDPLQMDYIHNKPEIPSIDGLASEDFVLEKCRENVLRYDIETDSELNEILTTIIQNFQDTLLPGDHLIVRQFHAGRENYNIYRDHVYILVQESPTMPLMWQKIVEDKTKRIVNRAGGKYTESFTLGELTFRPSEFWGSTTLEPTAWVGALPAAITLPDNTDENTVYTIRTLNAQSTTLIHGEMSLGIQTLPESWNTCESFYCGGCSFCQTHTLFVAKTDGTTNTISTNIITHTGPWEVIFGESSGGMSYSEWQTDFNKFKDVIVEYSYENYEGDDEAKGPVHSIDLHSDRELHYDYPVTELTINSLHKCYDYSVVQDWVVSFIAGDIDPIITVQANYNDKAVIWLNGKPQFRANKKYMLIFKEITDTIYIETKLLSEDTIHGVWLRDSFRQEDPDLNFPEYTFTAGFNISEILNVMQLNDLIEGAGQLAVVRNRNFGPTTNVGINVNVVLSEFKIYKLQDMETKSIYFCISGSILTANDISEATTSNWVNGSTFRVKFLESDKDYWVGGCIDPLTIFKYTKIIN